MSRGRHRRVKPRSTARTSLRVTASGAGLAIPLAGLSAAHSAPQDVWNKVAACESGNNWEVNTGNGYFGGLQFKQSTWQAFGGTVYASRADLASRDQQVAVAEKVLDSQGPQAWPHCGPKAGLARDQADPQRASRTQQRPAATTKRAAPPRKAGSSPQGKPSQRTGKPGKGDYRVRSGDSLSGIAEDQHVRGGWQSLYERNRSTVGEDPDLIYPGQKLRLSGKAPSRPAPAKPKRDTRASGNEAGSPPKSTPSKKAEPKKTESTRKVEAPKKSESPKPRQKASVPQQRAKPEQKPKATPKKTHTPKPKPKPQRSQARPAKPASQGFTTPVSGVSPSTAYRASGASWSSGYHTGVDFPVSTGTTVKAVGPATVVSAGWGGSYGYQVVLRHADGKYSQYAHLSAISVRSGQSVGGGQRIGRSGTTGNSTGPHLHFEVRTGPGYGTDINPLAYLRGHGVSI